MIVGLTGGIGSGKSVASHWFEQQGITVVDADIIARQVVEKGKPALAKIYECFGEWVLLEDGQLNRPALRAHIFQHPEARQALEKITHPLIRQEIQQQLKKSKSPYTILVSPLLFETGQDQLVDETLLIDTSIELQIERTRLRDNQNSNQIEQIILAQMPATQKRKRATHIIINDQDLPYLVTQLEKIHQHYLSPFFIQ